MSIDPVKTPAAGARAHSSWLPVVPYYVIAAAILGLCFAELHWWNYFSNPISVGPAVQYWIQKFLFLLTPILCFAAFARSKETLRLRVIVVVFSMFCAGYSDVLHTWIVDNQNFDPAFHSNYEWQLNLHHYIMLLAQGASPHVYRFLPDCIVSLFHWVSGDDVTSVHAYRLLANSLFYAMIYRYARVYLTVAASLGVVLTVTCFYPVTILKYNGQYTDPASHLSFALCFYWLATGNEAGFQSGFFTGIFAKESILVMALCRAFYGAHRIKSVIIAAVYLGLGLAVTFAIRRYINGAPIPAKFNSISGTNLDQVFGNWGARDVWWGMYVVTIGALLPGAIAGWRLMETPFKATCFLVTFATLSTNLCISLMWEERNVVPAFIPLAILNFKYAEHVALKRLRSPTGQTHPEPTVTAPTSP